MKKSANVTNQVVIITGASSGIGRATALAFAGKGAKTVLVSRNAANLERVAEEIRAKGGQATAIPADVSSAEQVNTMVQKVMDEFGRIDVLVNNAGTNFVGPIGHPGFIKDTKKMMAVDFFGQVHCTHAVLPIMEHQGAGHIANMSSVVGRKAFPKFAGYSATVHAIAAFSDALGQKVEGRGIHVSTIHPALTQTPLLQHVEPVDMPPPFKYLTPISADSVAHAVLRAVQKKHRRVIVPWQPRFLLLADAVSPRLGDWFVNMLSKSWFVFLLGMNRGQRYRHEQSYQP